MNLKNWIPLIAALVLGLLALVVARKALSKGDGQVANAPVTTVVVTNKDLPVGHQIKPTDLTVKRVTADGVITGSFPTVDKLDGRTVVVPLKAGDYVIESMLAPTGSGGGLSAMIPVGYRAMTLEVNEFTGVAGMIQPGSKVDVLAVLRDEKTSLPAVRTILQKVEVRAVGRNVAPPPSDPGAPPPPPTNNVTLLLT
ncbi:MAG TPA: Flp pilus assembly protein CpaB, partial [Humisphaera sp.]